MVKITVKCHWRHLEYDWTTYGCRNCGYRFSYGKEPTLSDWIIKHYQIVDWQWEAFKGSDRADQLLWAKPL